VGLGLAQICLRKECSSLLWRLVYLLAFGVTLSYQLGPKIRRLGHNDIDVWIPL
jgi:hypothetical protein